MLPDFDEDNPIAEIKKLERFLQGDEDGERPLDVLRARGVVLPEESDLDDEALHQKLNELFDEMAAIGMLLDSTDHLSDRELYHYLLTDALLEETVLPTSSNGAWHMSPIGGGSKEDNEVYLRFYANDETRERWHRDFGESLPPKQKLPYDRDRMLPTRSKAGTRREARH